MAHLRKVAVLLMYDSYGKILLQKRGDLIKNKNLPEKLQRDYGMFGGGLEGKETFMQALAREMNEELELDIKKLKNLEILRTAKIYIPELDMERDLTIFIAKMPDINKLKCHEGSPEIFTIPEALNLKISKTDKDTIKELAKRLKI
jgi:8-oxo-dGTP pyrophosphatase MutT (NUDIX family)